MILSYKGKLPVIGEHTYVSPNATIIGDVVIGEYCYVGPNAVVRGDSGKIVIGNYVAVEDGVIIHTSSECGSTIGNEVILGHAALIHSDFIGDRTLIGMGAILSISSRIASDCIICEGAVVKNNQETESFTMLGGAPAKVIKPIDEQYIKRTVYNAQGYGKIAQNYLKEEQK